MPAASPCRYLQPRFPKDMDFLRRLTAGAIAGLAACSASYPLDLVRTRLAAQTTSHYYVGGITTTLRRIVKEEGSRGLYRGLAATLVQVRRDALFNKVAGNCKFVTLTKMNTPALATVTPSAIQKPHLLYRIVPFPSMLCSLKRHSDAWGVPGCVRWRRQLVPW